MNQIEVSTFPKAAECIAILRTLILQHGAKQKLDSRMGKTKAAVEAKQLW